MLYGRFPIHGEMSENCWKNPQKRARWYEERRIMYVGVTRAKSKLVLLADENL
jgi:superfamily I DNA/RNA helicase